MREVDTGPHLVPTARPQITRLTFQYYTSHNNGFDAGDRDEKMLDTDIKRIRVRNWGWVRARVLEIGLVLGLVNSFGYGK